MAMLGTNIRILQAILILCCFNKLVSSQSRDDGRSLQVTSFGCVHTRNASVSFQNNLNLLLSDFLNQSSLVRYYNTSIGDGGPDTVHGYFMCRGDLSLPVCHSCILNGTQFASEVDSCKQYVNGDFNSELCTFLYSDQSFYGEYQVSITHVDYVAVNVSNYEQFNRTLSPLMEDLINETAYESQNNNNNGSMLGFATMESNVTRDETIYSLAQCSPDILGLNCSRCLQSTLSDLRTLDYNAPAALATRSKCQLRYGNVSFYNIE